MSRSLKIGTGLDCRCNKDNLKISHPAGQLRNHSYYPLRLMGGIAP